MKLPDLDPTIHQPTRLRIMTLLYCNRHALFIWLRDTLGLTSGNLGNHVDRLVDVGYIEATNRFSHKGTHTHYGITEKGDTAFGRYMDALARYQRTTLEPLPATRSRPPPDDESGP